MHRPLLLLLAAFTAVTALFNGDRQAPWYRHAYLVKIFARDDTLQQSASCTGTLISPSLVLTAADCVRLENTTNPQLMVSIVRPRGIPLRKRATVISESDDLAFLALTHPLKELCPDGSPSGHLARLPLLPPSLSRSSFAPFDWANVDTTTCRLLAFNSVRSAPDFLKTASVERATIKVEVDKETLIMRRTLSTMPAPCYEDIGAPFECLVGNDFIQLGVLVSLVAVSEKELDIIDNELASSQTNATSPGPTMPPSPLRRCQFASSAHFTILPLPLLAATIEQHDLANHVRVHKECANPPLL